MIAIYLPCSFNFSLGIVDNHKVWTAAFKAEQVDAEVFDSAV